MARSDIGVKTLTVAIILLVVQGVALANTFSVRVIDTRNSAVDTVLIGFGAYSPTLKPDGGRVTVEHVWETGRQISVSVASKKQPPWVLISPWDGQITVPSPDEATAHPIQIVLAPRGDREALQDRRAQEAMLKRVDAAVQQCIATNLRAPSSTGPDASADAARPKAAPAPAAETARRLVADQFGVPTSDLDSAVASLRQDSAVSAEIRATAERYESVFQIGRTYEDSALSSPFKGGGVGSIEQVFGSAIPGSPRPGRIFQEFQLAGRFGYFAHRFTEHSSSEEPNLVHESAYEPNVAAIQLFIDVQLGSLWNVAGGTDFAMTAWSVAYAANLQLRPPGWMRNWSGSLGWGQRQSDLGSAYSTISAGSDTRVLNPNIPSAMTSPYSLSAIIGRVSYQRFSGDRGQWRLQGMGEISQPFSASSEFLEFPRFTQVFEVAWMRTSDLDGFRTNLIPAFMPTRISASLILTEVKRWGFTEPFGPSSTAHAADGMWLGWRAVVSLLFKHGLLVGMGWRSERNPYGYLEGIHKLEGLEMIVSLSR
jgi:hypothetical protein